MNRNRTNEEITQEILKRSQRLTAKKFKKKRVIMTSVPAFACFLLIAVTVTQQRSLFDNVGVLNPTDINSSPTLSLENKHPSDSLTENPNFEIPSIDTPSDNSQNENSSDNTQTIIPSQPIQQPESNQNNDDYPDNGVAVPFIMIWSGNIYRYSFENQLSIDDLNKLITNPDSVNQTAYSIKGASSEKCIGYKANGKIHQYDCVYTAPLNIDGKDYYFVDRSLMEPDAESEVGDYMDTVDDMLIYHSTKYENAICVDIKNIIGVENSIFYIARINVE